VNHKLSINKQINAFEVRAEKSLLKFRRELQYRIRSIRQRIKQNKPYDQIQAKVEKLLADSDVLINKRQQAVCHIEYPPDLPISQNQAEISQLIEHNQVVIVAGETGSGKTTQLPKICLDLGRGIAGQIGHTQPRRIAARSVGQRIADETRTVFGQVVGYQVRFHDQIQPESRLKLMTDGILLAEIHNDPDLLQYDTLIIDEAHERSLNIDFLMGYLKKLLPRRPDLRLIVTSATIATERFAQFFNQAPVIEVSGRSYPVEIYYRPLHHENPDVEDIEMQQAILNAVDELSRIDRGDILIFLSGEREIRDTAEALRKHHPAGSEILPLYSRLSVGEQGKIFQAHSRQRIVLATNVAETSLTVPGIRYVIDTGYARISRYSYRSKVQRLPIEKISQASANQRKGRCGRISAGICVRLYDEDDFDQRVEFTEPEIQRTNLASVILNMKMIGLGDVDDYPFMDPPDRRFINDGYRLLFELGAVDDRRQLTQTGREMARLSIDPRLARMILQAKQESCLQEILIIASALECLDPRERPMDAQQKSDEAHKEFNDDASDFVSLLNLWKFYREQSRHLSQNKFRKLCQQRYLSFRRLREWKDLYLQISQQAREMGMRLNQTEASSDGVHRALLSGLVSQIGFNVEAREYQGTHGKKFFIFPGSGLSRKKPKWLMAAEIVETTRLYARTVAAIKPEWLEQVAPHMIKYSYSEPHWERRRGQVAATEKMTLYGLTLIAARKVNFGRIDPETSRKIFIRSALVQGDFSSKARCFLHNMEQIHEVQIIEAKSRRRDIQEDEQVLFDFYDEKIPADIYSQAAFEKWLRQQEKEHPDFLMLTQQDLTRNDAEALRHEDFPDAIRSSGVFLPLKYHFMPGDKNDGVTAQIPLAALNQIKEEDFDWLIPGLIREKILHLIKGLAKSLRRNFIPAPEYASACANLIKPGEESLLDQLCSQLKRMTGVNVKRSDWHPEKLPLHLRINFSVLDEAGKEIVQGRDLNEIQQQFRHQASDAFSKQSATGLETESMQQINDWDFDNLPESIEMERMGISFMAYPALIEQDGRIVMQPLDQLLQAERETRHALVKLFMKVCAKDMSYLLRNLPDIKTLCLYYAAAGQCDVLKEDILYLTVFHAMHLEDELIRSRDVFQQRVREARQQLQSVANTICLLLLDSLGSYQKIKKRLKKMVSPVWLKSLTDVQSQLDHLIYKNFLQKTDFEQLQQYPRYLKAIEKRLEKLEQQPERDVRMLHEITPFWKDCLSRMQMSGSVLEESDALKKFRWMVEEFRISLFTQEIKTAYPVSSKRLKAQWGKVISN